ncbi:unnamed protein product [Arctogadus glacialis]
MSWLLAVWISLGFLLACQATLYQTIQQHHVARPGRTDILTLGKSRLLLALARDIGKLEPPVVHQRCYAAIGCYGVMITCVQEAIDEESHRMSIRLMALFLAESYCQGESQWHMKGIGSIELGLTR